MAFAKPDYPGAEVDNVVETDVDREAEPEPLPASKVPPADDGLPSQTSSRGEMIRRYTEQHRCVSCQHNEVCEMGRHTSEMFREGWYVVVSDCNNFGEVQ